MQLTHVYRHTEMTSFLTKNWLSASMGLAGRAHNVGQATGLEAQPEAAAAVLRKNSFPPRKPQFCFQILHWSDEACPRS